MGIPEERFEYTKKAKKSALIVFVIGLVFSIGGFFMLDPHPDAHAGGHSEEHKDGTHQSEDEPYGSEVELHSNSQYSEKSNSSTKTNTLLVSTHSGGDKEKESHGDDHDKTHGEHAAHAADGHGGEDHGHGGHHGASIPVKRLLSNLWINNVFFGGIAIIGVFFFALQYVAQAGWSAGIKRIPLAFGSWLPIAFFLLLGTFLIGGHDIFHWTHADLYVEVGGDEIMKGKASYFFAPMESGTFPFFWIARLVVFFVAWYIFFRKLKSLALAEDLEGGTKKWYQMRKVSAIFLVFFAVSSSMAAWDWIMSIDAHWFSTMFGWYVFSSWWVSGLALTLFIVLRLKDKGLLSVVNENHIHDLGKFVFAFTVFWTYVWFSQFLLIYYAHIPEETIYFVDRLKSDHFAPIFFLNLIINFFLPFLLLMTRDAKRHARLLRVVCAMIILGHWIDFYLMVSPGTIGENSGFGFLELGLIMVYLSAFVYVTFNTLSKAKLFANNHPMLKESLHHHI
ncbi:MAG: quinol:cytochrome C oxidoreductase [Bacteroidota bacterium]